MCHGAGLRNPTLSDLVREVEFVDAHGELRTVSDPALLKTAAGSFGSFGIVTAYTLRLDKMTYADMRPHHAPVELAIPPPLEYILEAKAGNPKFRYIKELIAPHSQETLDAAYKEFVRQAENDYYAEWFWFPGQRDIWVNTWNNDGLESLSRNIPSDFEAFLEWLEEWIAEEVCNWAVFQLLPGESQAKILGFLTLLQMPNIKPGDPSRTSKPLRSRLTGLVTTELINGLHFRRGIQNLQCCSMHWEIGIPAQSSNAAKRQSLPPPATGVARSRSKRMHRKRFSLGKSSVPEIPADLPEPQNAPGDLVETGEYKVRRDWSTVQKAWWDGILATHAQPSILRLAQEMRIMSESNIGMAPQRGHTLGNCSIEVLTTLNTPREEWQKFCQKMTDTWLAYRDPTTGAKLSCRPHWCKQWSFLKIDNDGERIGIIEWMRKVAYKDAIPEFVEGVRKIGEGAGFTLDECKARFGNDLVDSLVWGGPVVQTGVPPEEPSRVIINRFKRWLKRLFH